MSLKKTPKDGVSISDTRILLGSSIGAYLKKKKVERVTIVINYNNNSVAIIDSGDDGYLLSYPNLALGISQGTVVTANIARFIDLEYSNIFGAKLLNEKTIIVENLPLKPAAILTGARVLVKPNVKLIILGSLILGRDILPEQIERKQPKLVTAALPLSKRLDRHVEPSNKKSEPSKTSIEGKEKPNNDIKDEAAPPSLSEAEQKRIDSEYSKMILGE